jgi:hypothetical protein
VLKNAVMATLSVNRTGGSTGPASVTYSTANGSAVAGTDYDSTSGTLTWADADTAPKIISVPVRNNPVLAASKTFTVTLANPLYGALGTVTTESVTITETPLDAWRLATFGANASTPGIGLPTDDPDGDGQDNQSEFIAGTVPTDATSVFTLQPGMAGGQMHLVFTAQTGVSYTIQYKNSLTDPTWLKLIDIAPSPGAQIKDIIDPAPVTQRFYRVATPQQP